MQSVPRRLLVFLVGATLFVPSIGRNLSGTWLVTPPSQEGIARWQTFIFLKHANRISGTTTFVPASDSGLRLERVNVQGDNVYFRAAGGIKWRGHFSDDNELTLTLDGGDGQAEPVRLKRLAAGEFGALKERVFANRPQLERLALPPLRNLPSNGLARTPIMGWNSWNHYSSTVDDKAVREAADALVSTGLRDVGYVYVNIDDGWQGSRDQSGVLHPNGKFPDMKGLADYVHARGLKFGIYSSPGPFSCVNYVGSHGYEAQDATTFAAWGVDLLKYDWCSAADIYGTRKEMRGRYQIMGEALEETSRPIVYSLSQYGLFDIGSWGREVGGNLWRISYDSNLGERWAAVSERFERNGNRKYSGPGGWNDPDMLLIGNGGLSLEEYRTHLTLWVILAAPLILGNDLKEMTTDIRAMLLNTEVIGIEQDPLGIQGRRVQKHGPLEVWSKLLGNQDVAVALFNRGWSTADMRVKWSDLGFPNRIRVRNLWEKKTLDPVAAEYSATIPPHGSVLLRLSKM